tara:strand:+ start:2145 stop:3716 length:1572 start_codon:yes stop_codon:yes gene_type:complete
MKVLFTDPISDEGKQILTSSDIEVIDLSDQWPSEKIDLSDIQGWIVRSNTKISEKLIKECTNLNVIGRAGVGVDNIDLDSATKNGVLVMNTPDANTISAAEHTVALLLALSRNIHEGYHSMVHGKWEREKFIGSELNNKTLGVVGLGKIGTEVIKRLNPFKMKILGFDPFIKEKNYDLDYVKFTTLDVLCSNSDFITIHVPKTDSTHGLFNLERFKRMKSTTKIINCSRGGIINEEDLLTALNKNIIGGAALDVFEKEPAINSNILKAKNILFTPHLGASTLEAKEGVSKAICTQVRNYLLNGKIGNALNIPVSDMDLINNLEPYLNLAEKLGSLHQQIALGPADTVSITTAGTLKETNLVALAFLKGFLQEIHGSTVNYINATSVAEDTGIQIEETYNHAKINYSNLISSDVKINENSLSIRGSLFGDSHPRIVYLDGFHMDLIPEGKALLIYNKDIPGVIGKVGTFLGNVNVNIAGYQLGRKDNSDIAIGIVRLDTEPSPDIIEQISDLDEVISATIISFD